MLPDAMVVHSPGHSPGRLSLPARRLPLFVVLVLLMWLGTVESAEDVLKLKRRASHCVKNVLTYRNTPPDMRGRFPLIVGRMVSFVEKITDNNWSNTLASLYKSGSRLRGNFTRLFDACLRDPCSEDPYAGTCMQNLVMYFHNRHNHACQEFTYTGCGRNFNIFVTREECHRVCVDGY
ncbi:carboxypeptidase inhibitor SmCI [Ixodes scapularis]|uniref:carboxypeptidase inhibitor SmCI n=1 Tax=Ixodes scapularis TaxID=6945 RepID=UPI001C37F4FA|nr:carboxypeptidase inhibitor SmCI [Ixodes scapularis]